MKRTWMILTATVLLMATWSSCAHEEDRGSLQFGFQLTEDGSLKSIPAGSQISAALVTIAGENGDLIYDKEYLPIYSFGDAYTTRSLKLPVGSFHLEEFMLIDSSGTVLWATPRAGSTLAHLVSDPLPVPFGIRTDETTTVQIEVIRTREYQPSDFGYATFQIGFVEKFCLKVFYSTRCLEQWNDSILGPDGTGAPVYLPMLSIWSGNRMVLHQPLNPGLNRYQVPLVEDEYHLQATDCHNQVIYRETLSLRELLDHPCLENAAPLVIYRDSLPGILITPEGLQSPTIRQGIFGRITRDLDSFMLLDSGDVAPTIMDLYLYPYAVLDSIMSFAPIDCYFPIHLIQTGPVAIVRTNSEGTFQVPMEAGEYLYVVRIGDAYYWDPYVSSHRPGYVPVWEGKVTEIYIHIIDCSMWM